MLRIPVLQCIVTYLSIKFISECVLQFRHIIPVVQIDKHQALIFPSFCITPSEQTKREQRKPTAYYTVCYSGGSTLCVALSGEQWNNLHTKRKIPNGWNEFARVYLVGVDSFWWKHSYFVIQVDVPRAALDCLFHGLLCLCVVFFFPLFSIHFAPDFCVVHFHRSVHLRTIYLFD